MTVFIQYLVNGLSMGSVYAIIALGYTMVYGIAKMLNFAHGDVIMVGAYVSFCATSYLGLPGWASVVLSCVVCTVLGVLIEGLAYKPLRQAGPLAVLITAIGVSYFLQNAAQLLWGATPKNFTSLVTFPVPEFLAKFNVSAVSLVTIVACLVIMAGLMFFTGKTKMGKAMRAVSEDKAAAQLMGINVNRTISMTFAIGSALAAIAGVLLLAGVAAHHGRHAWHQGLRRCRFRRHRLHPRCLCRRYSHRHHRGDGAGLHFHEPCQLHRLWCFDHRPARQACRPLGQVRPREGVGERYEVS